MGTLCILNVGAGDTKISFDPAKSDEVKNASRIITDMLKRGYALLIEVGTDADGDTIYKRARGFDEKTCEYIVAGAPEDNQEGTVDATPPAKPRGSSRSKGKVTEIRIKAADKKAIAVARTAGG
jgi:hypothetical protein